jgi:hypothetical protein
MGNEESDAKAYPMGEKFVVL